MLDLLAGEPTELTELQMVRSKPLPFPPEPLAPPASADPLVTGQRRPPRRPPEPLAPGPGQLGLGFDS